MQEVWLVEIERFLVTSKFCAPLVSSMRKKMLKAEIPPFCLEAGL
jgi:hypothetical protein